MLVINVEPSMKSMELNHHKSALSCMKKKMFSQEKSTIIKTAVQEFLLAYPSHELLYLAQQIIFWTRFQYINYFTRVS